MTEIPKSGGEADASTSAEGRRLEAMPETSFRILFESAPDAIFVEDLTGRVLDANPAACLLHGMTREQLIGSSVSELIPPANRKEALEQFHAMASGELDQVEGFSYTSDGESVPVSVRARRLVYEGHQALLFHVSDLTRQRQLEEQLFRSRKMEAIGRLAGGIAHDFNNLLTTILGYTELSLNSLDPEHDARGDLLEVQKAGEQAAKLTAQLLAFSRQQVLSPRVLNLNEVVANIEELCRRAVGDEIALVTRLAPDLGETKVDQAQLEQVIVNLAANSRDAMPRGGEVVIETQNVILDGERFREGIVVPAGKYVSLKLSDNGRGMTPEVRKRAFDPFFTTKEPHEAAGLGLSTVYGIVKQSGGFIWVDSEPGKGTSIQIIFRRAESEPDDPFLSAEESQAEAKSSNVLLIDDNAAVRELGKRFLEKEGYRVLAAGSAEEGLRLCRESGDRLDLLITDLVLPGIDGESLARKVLDLHPDARVLLMSGHSRRARFRRDPLMEDISFLQKPFTRAGLERAVAAALGGDSLRR